MDKGDDNLIMSKARDENESKGNLVCLGEYNFRGVFFINFQFINDNAPKPVKVDGADVRLAFKGGFYLLDSDFFN